MWNKTKEQRPLDGQEIIYYFAPFKTYHLGKYSVDEDAVHGKSGFTSMVPEVPYWMELPKIFEENK